MGAVSGVALRSQPSHAVPGNPFTLGVASSPLNNVLWTRLASEPLASDGRGGMPDHDIWITWKVARQADKTDIIASGQAATEAEWGHSVHVEVPDLPQNTEVFYWFEYGVDPEGNPFSSRVGRLKTAPAFSSAADFTLRVGVISCTNLEHGYFHSYRNIAAQQLDLVVCLGDFIYADSYLSEGGHAKVRTHLPEGAPNEECFTLADFRVRHAQYRLDEWEQELRASTGMLFTIDDHEIDNDWGGSSPEAQFSAGPKTFWQRRENGLRAFWENLPLPNDMRPQLSLMPNTYRTLHWGRLADFHLLDTRQFRSKVSRERNTHEHQYMLGPVQLSSLGHRYRGARWDFLLNQLVMAYWDVGETIVPGLVYLANVNAWDGYTKERERVVQQWVERGVRNPVVLTGDIHAASAGRVRSLSGEVMACEVVTSSVSSGGNGRGDWDTLGAQALINRLLSSPDTDMFGQRRGWVKLVIDQTATRVEWRGTTTISSEWQQPDELFARAVIPDGLRTFDDRYSQNGSDFTWEV
ncbi:alkaline phosphatase D family protein [Streptomyces sp. Lzd4kr]|nr:alkaline phosphatase D family protein [Streptomyces sp. Lzd4kr]